MIQRERSPHHQKSKMFPLCRAIYPSNGYTRQPYHSTEGCMDKRLKLWTSQDVNINRLSYVVSKLSTCTLPAAW